MKRALIIGQAPARSAELGQRPWDSASGRRLAKMMDISHEEMLETFDTCNLNTDLHGTIGKYDEFDVTEARHMADYLRRSILWQYDVVLLCGARVAKAFGLRAPSTDILHVLLPWEPLGLTHLTVFAIPHPGGTNMWWNSAENRLIGEGIALRAREAVCGPAVATNGVEGRGHGGRVGSGR